MNIYQKNKKFSWQKITIGIIALILFIAILNIFQSPIKNTFYIITSPISKMFWGTGNNASGFFGSFFNNSLTQENNNLKEENQNLLNQISSLQETIKEDQAIKQVIQNTQKDNFKMVSAEVIGLDASNDFILLNRGSNDKISENMPVISSTKVLYGKVFKVYKNFSQVMLISNKNSVVDVSILNNDSVSVPVSGAVKGSANLSVYLDLVSSDASIAPEDALNTSGLEGIYPKNLLIGKITSIDENDLKPFQTARVQPFFNTQNIDTLFIITNYKR